VLLQQAVAVAVPAVVASAVGIDIATVAMFQTLRVFELAQLPRAGFFVSGGSAKGGSGQNPVG